MAQEPCGHQGRDEDTSAQLASAPEHAGGFLCCPPLPLSSPRSPPPLVLGLCAVLSPSRLILSFNHGTRAGPGTPPLPTLCTEGPQT